MNQQQRKHRRRHMAAPLGGLFVIFAVIGIITVVVYSIQLTFRMLDNDAEKEAFENIIRPVVMFDPMPFESPTDIEMTSLLQYSMWAALTGEKRGSYEYGDNAELIVPASDLDVSAARLFGPDIQLIHQSFGDYDNKYYFDEVEQIYNVPVMAQLLVYSPRVEEITKEGDYFRLKVAYIPPSSPWSSDYFGNSGQPAADKYMVYLMTQNGDHYQIAKVQDMPESSSQPGGGNTVPGGNSGNGA